MKRLAIFALLAGLSGCGFFQQLDRDASAHFPVISERCEHWQCFTGGGKLASEANRMERLCGVQTIQPVLKPQ